MDLTNIVLYTSDIAYKRPRDQDPNGGQIPLHIGIEDPARYNTTQPDPRYQSVPQRGITTVNDVLTNNYANPCDITNHGIVENW